jgi:glycosyltransferase involved in cell wall biosynthesis
MSNKKLTIIIPFLNEKSEVENTVKSTKAHSNNTIEILLINDASNDGFDYKSVAEKYDVVYIENTERMGVAASRDLGVHLCQTPYFLLLDAHMRFYDHSWTQRIIEELETDQKTLLCCQTKVLRLENSTVVVDIIDFPSHGAYIEFDNGLGLT